MDRASRKVLHIHFVGKVSSTEIGVHIVVGNGAPVHKHKVDNANTRLNEKLAGSEEYWLGVTLLKGFSLITSRRHYQIHKV